MKKNLLKMAFFAIALMMTTNANAQWQDVLKSAAGGILNSATNGASNAVTDIVNNLLGTSNVSEGNIEGTWNYNEPCIAFESDNILTQLGSSAASKKAEKYMKTGLDKVGFTHGKVTMTLNKDKTGTISYNGKPVNVNWEIEGSNLTIIFPITQKRVTMNVKLVGTELQVAMKADKLIALLTNITNKATTVNASFGTVASLLKNVKGMYLGLKFTK